MDDEELEDVLVGILWERPDLYEWYVDLCLQEDEVCD